MKISIPGKIFIAGEYAALQGLPTLSVAVDPSFVFQSGHEEGELSFHPDSPAGGLAGRNTLQGNLFDPYASTGGMGKSTAEFLVKYFSGEKPSKSVEDIWKTYRSVTAAKKTPPSGVDVVTQVLGGYCVTEWAQGKMENSTWSFENLDWAVILTGHKVKTHEHLEALGHLNWSEIENLNRKIVDSFQIANEESFIAHMQAWRQFLVASSLEVPTTTEIVEALLEVPGVMAAKGCGALGSDAVFIVFEKSSAKLMDSVLEDWNANSVIRSSQVSITGVEVDYEDLHIRSL